MTEAGTKIRPGRWAPPGRGCVSGLSDSRAFLVCLIHNAPPPGRGTGSTAASPRSPPPPRRPPAAARTHAHTLTHPVSSPAAMRGAGTAYAEHIAEFAVHIAAEYTRNIDRYRPIPNIPIKSIPHKSTACRGDAYAAPGADLRHQPGEDVEALHGRRRRRGVEGQHRPDHQRPPRPVLGPPPAAASF